MLLEVAGASVTDCLTAQECGADRVELNSALQLGGLTPSLGLLVEVKRRVRLPVIAMVRPRAGGFCYREAELQTMLRDAELLLEHDADGLAFGFLKEDGRIDEALCRRFLNQVRPAATVFHRAFDLTPDPVAALETLIDLGIDRVMTSGGEASADAGVERIAALHEQAGRRIEILPAAGINPTTFARVLAHTGCEQLHASLSRLVPDRSGGLRPQVSFNAVRLYNDRYPATDADTVHQMRALLDQWKVTHR